MKQIVIGMTLFVIGCTIFGTSDRTFLSNASAEYIFQENRYESECVAKAGAECQTFQADLIAFKAKLKLAVSVAQVGALPATERSQLNTLISKVRADK